MKVFWLFFLILNLSSIVTNLIAFDVNGKWFHLICAVVAMYLAYWSAKKMDES